MWKQWWLLFTVIWIVVTGLQVFLILVFSPDEREKALQPLLLLVAVPAVLYVIGWAIARRKK